MYRVSFAATIWYLLLAVARAEAHWVFLAAVMALLGFLLRRGNLQYEVNKAELEANKAELARLEAVRWLVIQTSKLDGESITTIRYDSGNTCVCEPHATAVEYAREEGYRRAHKVQCGDDVRIEFWVKLAEVRS